MYNLMPGESRVNLPSRYLNAFAVLITDLRKIALHRFFCKQDEVHQ